MITVVTMHLFVIAGVIKCFWPKHTKYIVSQTRFYKSLKLFDTNNTTKLSTTINKLAPYPALSPHKCGIQHP